MDIDHEKLQLEAERLALEKESLQQQNRFLRRNSSVIIASFVPLVVAAISVVQLRNSNLNDRRERLINYVKFINDNVRQLRASDDVMLHRQTAYMTTAVLDPEDRCPTLAYIANTVAKNRTIREIYEREAAAKRCTQPAARSKVASAAVLRGSLVRVAAAGGDTDKAPQDIRAIYLYRQKDDADAAKATQAVTQALNELGYNVPGENEIETRITQNEIRYFNERDEAAATTVQSQLAEATGVHFVVADYSTKDPARPGFLEIYIAD